MKQSSYIRTAINALKNEGWILTAVDDGESPALVANTAEAMDLVMNVEECYLIFENATLDKKSWVRIVWQGPDETCDDYMEVICDYGMKLDSILSTLGG